MNKLQNKLISIFLNRFDGKLEITNSKIRKALFFKRGEVVFSQSSEDQHLFLQQLLSKKINLHQQQIQELESLNHIDEQQKYILKNNFLDTATIFNVRKLIVEESFLRAFSDTYESISVHKGEEFLDHKLSFSIDTLKCILKFVEKYIEETQHVISSEQMLFLSSDNKKLFSHLKLSTDFSKMIDRLSEKKYRLKDLEELNIVHQSNDTFVFLNFMFFLGVLGKVDPKNVSKEPTQHKSVNLNSENNAQEDLEDLKEKQIDRLVNAPPHVLISADKNLSKTILYKNTQKLIKRYDILSQLNQQKYHQFYLKLIESLYILTSSEESKRYYQCIANSEPYQLEKNATTEARLLYTQARILFLENMLSDALKKVEEAINKDASLIEISIFKYELILYYCEKNQKNPSDKIETFLKMIIESDAQQVDARMVLAQYYRMIGDKMKQLAQMSEVLELNPDDILLKKKISLLKMQVTKSKNIKSNSGVFKMEKSNKKQSFFANLFKKKDKK